MSEPGRPAPAVTPEASEVIRVPRRLLSKCRDALMVCGARADLLPDRVIAELVMDSWSEQHDPYAMNPDGTKADGRGVFMRAIALGCEAKHNHPGHADPAIRRIGSGDDEENVT